MLMKLKNEIRRKPNLFKIHEHLFIKIRTSVTLLCNNLGGNHKVSGMELSLNFKMLYLFALSRF